TRLSGASRYETSAAISKASFGAGVPVAYVANGATFPDALSGAPVAGMNKGPVLLVAAGSIPDAISAELKRLKPKKIVILGGAGAVSSSVENQLKSFTVR
uniref:cell wall-binding repeat-containing protein n=1 Tax=Microbacterium sp. USHLN186 TaxID=3081286 RepID=UPI00301A2AE0